MGLLIASAELIKSSTGAHVQLVHHTGKNGEAERGSSALRGAVGTMLKVTNDDDMIKLECDKQKDAAPFDKWRLSLTPTADGESCTVEVVGGTGRSNVPNARDVSVLEILETHFGQAGASTTEWLRVAKDMKIADRTFYRARRVLVDAGYIELNARRYQPTEAGRALLPLPNDCQPAATGSSAQGREVTATTATTPLGVAVSGSNPGGPPTPGRNGQTKPADLLPWQGGDDGGGVL
jgi:hypothetical protein